MISNIEFPFKKLTVFSIVMLGLCFWAGNTMAQSEREKSEVENEKPLEKPLVENNSDRFDMQLRDNPTPVNSNTTTVSTVKPPLPKKETNLSGEGKKPDPAASTLTFNIFLYIVDKFKAD
ncbi:hypothetical protein [uncultured Algoriphagus sp.]|uniref:hypothetical protein n=1 Tax=uncultured Algoriphagus sp. TaxID=417365 RepID=UPI0030EE1E25|tara:strand:- start:23023 stop:23382 length:360 start_codon:yes stop_codon:yes gene_type:complete